MTAGALLVLKFGGELLDDASRLQTVVAATANIAARGAVHRSVLGVRVGHRTDSS